MGTPELYSDLSTIFATFSRFKFASFYDLPTSFTQSASIPSQSIKNFELEDIEPPKERSNFDEAFLTKLFCLEHWFLRCSWVDKRAFLRKMNDIIHSNKQLPNLLYQIDKPTKDMLYQSTQYTNTVFDIIPEDYNRSLNLVDSVTVEDFFLQWINSIRPFLQVKIYTALLKLSGSALSRAVYKDICEILTEEQERISESVASQSISKRKKELSLHSSMTEPSASKNVKPYSNERKVFETDFFESQYYQPFKNLMRQWIDLENSLIQKAKLRMPRSDISRTSPTSSPGIDLLQLLPIWINKKIVSYLNSKAMKKMSKVNLYWKGVVREVEKEMRGRKQLNRLIKSLEKKYGMKPLLKSDISMKSGLKSIYQTKSKKLLKTKREMSTKQVKWKSPVDKQNLIISSEYEEREDIGSIIKKDMQYEHAFNWRHKVIGVSMSFVHERRISAKKKWIASSDGSDIKFHNLITGAPLPYALRTLPDCSVTCIAIHESDDQVYVGGQDGSLVCWGIWSQKPTAKFAGDKDAIINMSIFQDHLATISLNYFIKVYQKKIQDPIWSSNEYGEPTCLYMLSHEALVFGNSDGAVFKVNINSKVENQMIESAHSAAVSCINYKQGLLLSGGEDKFARVWNGETFNPIWILSFLHSQRISGIDLSLQKIITGCDDGKLRIWDIFTRKIIRKIDIEVDQSPILQFNCLDDIDHTKIVVNTNASIKVCEFPKGKAAARTCKAPSSSTARKSKPHIVRKMATDIEGGRGLVIREGVKTREEQRLQALAGRMATLPALRKSIDPPLTHAESVIPPLLVEGGQTFQREGPSSQPLYKIRREILIKKWEEAERAREEEEAKEVKENPRWRVKAPTHYFSYKSFLPIYNPYKFCP